MELIYNIHQLEMTENNFPALKTKTEKKRIEKEFNASSEHEPLYSDRGRQAGGAKEECLSCFVGK